MDVIKHSCGILWIITYLLVIRRGHLDKSYGIPFISVTMNVAWELFDSFFSYRPIMHIYSIAWLMLDIVILYQVVVCRAKRRRKLVLLYSAASVCLVAAWFTVLHFSNHTHLHFLVGAFFQNAIMSLLYIPFILSRKELSGQSICIALCKLAATGVVIVANLANGNVSASNNLLVWLMYLTILGADTAYLFLYLRFAKKNGVKVWARL